MPDNGHLEDSQRHTGTVSEGRHGTRIVWQTQGSDQRSWQDHKPLKPVPMIDSTCSSCPCGPRTIIDRAASLSAVMLPVIMAIMLAHACPTDRWSGSRCAARTSPHVQTALAHDRELPYRLHPFRIHPSQGCARAVCPCALAQPGRVWCARRVPARTAQSPRLCLATSAYSACML